MRRVWLGQLVLLAALGMLTGSTRFARAADAPYEGTWKVIVLNSYMGPRGVGVDELSVWLVKLDKAGKTADVISALPDPNLKDVKASELKAEAGSLRFLLKGARAEFSITAYPSKGKAEILQGTARVGYNFIPVRLEKTDATEIDLKTAQHKSGGEADLKAAMETKDAEDRIKDLEDVVKTYEGKQVTFLASQMLMGDLIRKKAGADAFKVPANALLKFCTPFGPEMELQAHTMLSRIMVGYDKTAGPALDHVEKAAKLLKDDENRGVKLNLWIALANAQHKNGKDDDVKKTLALITQVTEDVIKKPRIAVGPLLPTQQMASMLLASTAPLVADMGLEYARRAVKLLKDDTPKPDKLATYKLLHGALIARGKADEAKEVATTIEKMEEQLDKEYLKTAMPFTPEKFAGRKGKSDRVTVVEVFTGAQCPPCVAADLAFDGLDKSYQAAEVALLQYHLHIPGPDPMTNPDTEKRSKFYADDIEGTPTMFVDGKVTEGMGGAKLNAKPRYESLRKLVDAALENAPEAKINLKVTRMGDKIDVAADVADLKQTGAKVKLRFLLVEESVRYQGNNRLRLHHHVVRALPGGADGFKLEAKSSSHKASIDVADLRKKLLGYVNAVAARTQFPFGEVPMVLKNLKVIALIQDDDSKKIFQAAQAHVPEANAGK